MSQHRHIIELAASRGGVIGGANQNPVVEDQNIMLIQPPASLQIPTMHPTTSPNPTNSGDEETILQAKSTTPISTNEQTAIYLAAGAAAGIMEHCVMFPIDSVKTRMQSLHPHPNASYRNIKHAITKIVKTEGKLRAFRGVNAVALGAAPAHALYFTSYESTKKLLDGRIYGGENASVAAAAVVATLFHDAVMNPAEVIKQRIQVYNSPYKGIIQCARGVFATEGFPAFYRSFSTTLLMNLPFQTLHFLTYETTKNFLMGPDQQYNWKAHLIAGGVAGGFAAGMTSPFDVARTLLNTQERCVIMQCQQLNTCQYGRISGMKNAFRTIYEMHGVRGYFRGVTARVLFQIPATAISWSVYEFFKHSMSLQISEEEMVDLTL